jgi:aryl-alcohol dehydrogenase-like predicted oxidoreductase
MSLKTGLEGNKAILKRALELGINYFDTADLYEKGENEKLIGQVLKENRKELIIATKVGNQWRPDGTAWDWNATKNYILSAVEKSLHRLDTDYIDLYQLHGGTMQDPIDETIEAFELLVQQGKIRYYGISSIRPNVIREYVSRSNIISVMMQYSLLDQRPAEDCLPFLLQNNIGVLARGSIAQGLLINKSPENYLNYTANEVALAAKAINSVSNNIRSNAQTALHFILNHPAVTAAVVGMRTKMQLEDALATFNVPYLTKDEMHRLQKAIPVNYYTEHR